MAATTAPPWSQPWRSPSTSPSTSPSPSPPSSPPSSSTQIWRKNAGPIPSVPFRRLASHNVLQLGSVLHLPVSPPDRSSVIYKGLRTGSQPWGHAVVIIGKWVDKGVEYVKMRTCTSFNHTHIAAYKDRRYHHQWLLAENDEDNMPHDGRPLVTFKKGSGRFQRRTYINIVEEFTIEYNRLESWTAAVPKIIGAGSIQRLV